MLTVHCRNNVLDAFEGNSVNTIWGVLLGRAGVFIAYFGYT